MILVTALLDLSNCEALSVSAILLQLSGTIYSADKLIALIMILITTITLVESLGMGFSVGIPSVITPCIPVIHHQCV